MKAGAQAAHVPDLGVGDDVVRWRATIFLVWMAAFIALVFLVGFIPAIALFVFGYMRFGFGEPWVTALGFCVATALVCYVVFQWALAVAWLPSLLGDLFPARAATGLI
jgi:Tripartite tricarboxylate transporter TctB family